jgi:hypothetical protein
MRKRAWTVFAVAAAVWLIGPLLLGSNASGVELGAWPQVVPSASDQPPVSSPCATAHTYDSRGWAGWQTLRSDVWVMGCKDTLGHLRLASGPTCAATSFLGAGTATCTASPAGDRLKVVVHISYPFVLDWLSGRPSTTAWTLSPDGGYFAATP